MNNGWIKLHRVLKENPIYTESKAVHCWIECLLRAAHKKRTVYLKREKKELNPGQFVMGRREFGKTVGMSGSTAWYWLRRFEADRMVDIKKTTKGSIVTVLKWNEYQQVDRTVDNKKTAKKQQKNTNKNVKKVKNDKNEEEKTIASSKFTEFDYHLSKEFLAYQKQQFPKLVNNEKKDIKNGADTIRLLREQDDFTEEEITEALRFAVKDDFWRDKVLSIANIRTLSKNGNTKFQNIYRKYKNKPKTRTEQVMDIDLSEGDTIWNT